jgi:hypothetical protein
MLGKIPFGARYSLIKRKREAQRVTLMEKKKNLLESIEKHAQRRESKLSRRN